MPVVWVCFTNKKMGKMCMYMFMNSTYSPFLTAVIHRNQEEPAEQEKNILLLVFTNKSNSSLWHACACV